jgi:3-hydroxyisobutyrate dehydrogenase-like beta-hydroxyacid dehydrogenase
MALRLADTGWRLAVLDQKPERLRPLLDAGALAASPAELAESQLICFAVPDHRGVRAVLDDGLLAHLTPSHTVVVHSTILPSRARELASFIEEGSGARYIDAPVSGGPERARSGQLTLLLGGEGDALEAARPLLDDLGTEQFRLGGVGGGSATKLANQLITFTALAGVHEALRLAEAFGVPEGEVLEAVATGTGDTWVGRNLAFFDHLAQDYTAAGVPLAQRPWSKDMQEVLAAARDLGLALPTAARAAETVAQALEAHASGEGKGIHS